MKSKYYALFAAAAIALFAPQANATFGHGGGHNPPPPTESALCELALLIDGSGSMSPTEFGLQITGYVNALTAILPTNGTVAVGVWQFSTSVQQEFATTVINNQADKNALIAAIAGMSQLGGFTAIGQGIAAAGLDLLTNQIASDKQIIDVSTDGRNNVPPDPVLVAGLGVAFGIEQINGIGIGLTGPDPAWVQGDGAFFLQADTFADFEDAITRKLNIEIGDANVPEGGYTVMLLGLAIGFIEVIRRRNNR
jgi:hypothetical protein